MGTYLGVPIIHIHGCVKKTTYAHVVDKVLNKLTSWKGKVLSYASRKTLIQFTLSYIPLYTMQTAILPVSVCERLDQCNRNFLGGGSVENTHGHFLSWDRVCRPKGNGGLGLRKARLSNVALMAKIGWKLQTRHQSLSCEIYQQKYLKGKQFIEADGNGQSSS